ncbi:circadian clock-controlled protein daywake [Amyelois transitella]|uniref:circadian clock-controlled protein daywake n=1 Tax=Amyelois transitella TaxID=680683 RepID=UPI00298F60BE|nr:circadian clock-controlled protein daywake [Amyelois transitella]
MFRYFCFFAVILAVQSASAPFITPCKAGDNACIVSSAQAAVPSIAEGVPDLGIKPLDPMVIPLIQSDQGGLHLVFRDTVVTGMKGCVVEGIKHDLSKSKQTVTIRCSVTLKGDYTLDGRIIILPVQGEGKYTITIRDILIKTFTELKTVQGSDGKPHWHIQNWSYKYDTKTGARFQFDNLFNGNRILADPVDQFLNSNWREVMQEVAPPIVKATVQGVVEAVEALYKAVPAEHLFIS